MGSPHPSTWLESWGGRTCWPAWAQGPSWLINGGLRVSQRPPPARAGPPGSRTRATGLLRAMGVTRACGSDGAAGQPWSKQGAGNPAPFAPVPGARADGEAAVGWRPDSTQAGRQGLAKGTEGGTGSYRNKQETEAAALGRRPVGSWEGGSLQAEFTSTAVGWALREVRSASFFSLFLSSSGNFS